MKSVLVVATALSLFGVAQGKGLKNVKRGLNHGEYSQSSNDQAQALPQNIQNSSSESFAQLQVQSSQNINPPLPTPGIPPKFLSFSTPEEKANAAASQQRTPPFLDEDRNSVIQDSALAPQPSPSQFDAQNLQQGAAIAGQPGVTETVVSTGTAPAEGTVIGAPYLIAIHRNIIRRYGIPVAKPYLVQVPKNVKVVIERPVPYKIDKPYAVRVNVPQPYAVDRPYPVPVDAPYPVRVSHPVGVPVPQPVPVHVPHPVGVPVPQPVAVHVPQHVGVPQPYLVPVAPPAPAPLPLSQPAPLAVAQPAPLAVAQSASFGLAQAPPSAQLALAPSASTAFPQPTSLNFPRSAPLSFSNIR